jgi:ubiquinone/menaquinone biosynthesis C-methylase UbiE
MSNARTAFHIVYIECDFIIDVLDCWLETHPGERPVFTVWSEEEAVRILARYPHLVNRGDFVLRQALTPEKHPEVKLWLCTEQGGPPVDGIASYSCFHGQPSKGQTLTPKTDKGYAGYLLYGPLHREAIEQHYLGHYGALPETPLLINAGYPRSDALLNGKWKKEAVLAEMGLDPARSTILYAPAFNEGASLRECGKDLVAELVTLRDCNILIKLSVDNFGAYTDFRRNGGINWFEELAAFECLPRVRLSRDLNVFPALAAADVLITDVSSVGLDFFTLGKPVLFMDSPKFYDQHLKLWFPHEDTASWVDKPYVNGGRQYGTVVKSLSELPGAVRLALEQGYSPEFERQMRAKLLYNPGQATQRVVKILGRLLEKHAADNPRAHKPKKYTRADNAGFGFINARQTEDEAATAGLSINDYLEADEDTPKKRGHRDRIIEAMRVRGLLDIADKNALEIGAGTGRFLEKTLEGSPARYEVYETAEDWVESLRRRFVKPNSPVVLQPADGVSLSSTPTGSCDLVCAHAVFVAVPFLGFTQYLMEISRVCKIGASACFDVFYDTDWSLMTARAWITGNYQFPVILSRPLAENMYADLGFAVQDEFTEIYGASCSRYIVLKKTRRYI